MHGYGMPRQPIPVINQRSFVLAQEVLMYYYDDPFDLFSSDDDQLHYFFMLVNIGVFNDVEVKEVNEHGSEN